MGLDDVPPWMRLGDLPLNKRQLVEVAKAIARDARILVMDEPTAALQSQDIVNLYAVVRRLRAAGMGIIFISHHLEEVFELADSAVVMRDGATVGARPMSEWTEAELVQAMVARNLESFYPSAGSRASTAMSCSKCVISSARRCCAMRASRCGRERLSVSRESRARGVPNCSRRFSARCRRRVAKYSSKAKRSRIIRRPKACVTDSCTRRRIESAGRARARCQHRRKHCTVQP